MCIIKFNNSKLGSAVGTLDFIRVKSCRPDAPCISGCYMKKLCMLRTNMSESHEKNLQLWTDDPEQFKERIRHEIKWSVMRLLRVCSDGDIPNKAFLEFLFDLAEEFPDRNILLLTKKYEIVNELIDVRKKPLNLSIVLSSWGTWVPENPHNLPTSWVVLKSGEGADLIPKDAYECKGGCAECDNQYHCWFMSNGDSVKFHQH